MTEREATDMESHHVRCRALTPAHGEDGEAYCETENGRWVGIVKKFIQGLDYGEVVLSVHAGKVVQVERTEKVRFH